jgi:hypothetical protein
VGLAKHRHTEDDLAIYVWKAVGDVTCAGEREDVTVDLMTAWRRDLGLVAVGLVAGAATPLAQSLENASAVLDVRRRAFARCRQALAHGESELAFGVTVQLLDTEQGQP